MKATELMIGDWVYCFDPDEPNDKQINKVSAIRKEYNQGAIRFEEYSDWFEDEWFAPVPLTTKILWKNCPYPEIVEWYPDKSKTVYHIHIESLDITIDGFVKYIHELQRALRLCGLDDLATNFRV